MLRKGVLEKGSERAIIPDYLLVGHQISTVLDFEVMDPLYQIHVLAGYSVLSIIQA